MAFLPAARFQSLATHLVPRQVANILGVDLTEVEAWLRAPASTDVPRWACRLLALETGQSLDAEPIPLRKVHYDVDGDAVVWLLHTEAMRTGINNWHEDANLLDSAGHVEWFTDNGAFCLPTIFKQDDRFSFNNGRHRSAILSRFLSAIPVGVIDESTEGDLWPMAIRRLEPGELILLPQIPLYRSSRDFTWQPPHLRFGQ